MHQVPRLNAPGCRRGQSKVAGVLEDAVERSGRGEQTRPAPVVTESRERVGDGIRVRLKPDATIVSRVKPDAM